MDARERVIDLGDAVVVDDDDPRVVRARQPRGPRGLVRHWRQRLRRQGLALVVDELFGGWTRTKITLGPSLVLVVLFPLEFPAAPPIYHLVDTRAQTARSLPLAFSVEATEVVALARKEAA